MLWQFMLILNALNAKTLISEEGKIVLKRWTMLEIKEFLNLRNWFVQTVVKFL